MLKMIIAVGYWNRLALSRGNFGSASLTGAAVCPALDRDVSNRCTLLRDNRRGGFRYCCRGIVASVGGDFGFGHGLFAKDTTLSNLKNDVHGSALLWARVEEK